MRVLLDECVPRALRNDLPDHEVKTVAELGWAGVKNGELLRLAAAAFDVLITVDRNLEYQQSFAGLSLADCRSCVEQRHRCSSAVDAGGRCRHRPNQAGRRDARRQVGRGAD
jgi:hypothetical protein